METRERIAHMKQQLLAAVGVTMGLCAVATVAVYSADQGAQAAKSATAGWTAPKTPWGHPDLQGVWTTDLEIGVPFERPVELGEKALLTEAEYRQRAETLKKRYSDNKSDRARRGGQRAGSGALV